jgi:hypothetical protein
LFDRAGAVEPGLVEQGGERSGFGQIHLACPQGAKDREYGGIAPALVDRNQRRAAQPILVEGTHIWIAMVRQPIARCPACDVDAGIVALALALDRRRPVANEFHQLQHPEGLVDDLRRRVQGSELRGGKITVGADEVEVEF